MFEYTDEWWKGVQSDTYHTGCFHDTPSVQSTCGFTQPTFGPDGRLNEEWFGLYNITYPGSTDWELLLQPRPAVAALQTLWNRTTAAPAGVKSRRSQAAVATKAGTVAEYSAIFPSRFAAHFSGAFMWLLLPLVPAVVMLPLVVVPYMLMTQKKGKQVAPCA